MSKEKIHPKPSGILYLSMWFYFSPAAFRFSQAEIVSKFQNILGFINATKCKMFNKAAINIIFRYCQAAQGVAH